MTSRRPKQEVFRDWVTEYHTDTQTYIGPSFTRWLLRRAGFERMKDARKAGCDCYLCRQIDVLTTHQPEDV